MNCPTDILVLTKDPEKAANLGFLLQLSRFRAVHIRDDIEAFNYLVHRQNSPQPFGMMVICDADLNQPILQLLDELERRDAMLPVLLLRGHSPIPLQQLSIQLQVKNQIKQCDSSLTPACLREMLETLNFKQEAQVS